MSTVDSEPGKHSSVSPQNENGTLLRTLSTPSNFSTPQTGGATGTNSQSSAGSGWQFTNLTEGEHSTHTVLQSGDTLKQRFILDGIIGKGGMGTVFRARDLRKVEAQDRDPYVAIKILNENFRQHPDSLKQLQREARKAQKLSHPNIVSVYDFDRDGDNIFIVMELLEGNPLDKIIKESDGTGMPADRALDIIKQLADALGYAHSRGVIHLDFKPANAFLTREGIVKILDFGIAKVKPRVDLPEAETTRFNVSDLGALTPSYASCEMLSGQEADPRDDIYALACVAYELFTGKHPFGRQSAQFAKEFKLKPAKTRALSQSQWQALSHGLAFDRDQRVASTELLMTELTVPAKQTWKWIAIAATVVIVAGSAAWYAKGRVTEEIKPIEPPPQVAANTSSSTSIHVPAADTTKAGSAEVTETSPVTSPVITQTQPNSTGQQSSKDKNKPSELDNLKEQLLSAASNDDVTTAKRDLARLKSQLPASDPFVTRIATTAIARSYLRLAGHAFDSGSYQLTGELISSGQQMSGDVAELSTLKIALTQALSLENHLRNGNVPDAAVVQKELTTIRASYASGYSNVERNMANVLLKRIEAEPTQSAQRSALLKLALQCFPGVSSFAALRTPSTPSSPTAAPAPSAVVANPVANEPAKASAAVAAIGSTAEPARPVEQTTQIKAATPPVTSDAGRSIEPAATISSTRQQAATTDHAAQSSQSSSASSKKKTVMINTF